MLTSLALVFLVGLALAALCQKLKLPRIIGMLATGILLGPCVLNVLDGSILSISADLRKLALVIILLKAGLSLDLGDLKKVGRPAILMSCLPATCEIIGYVLLAPCFLGVTRAEAAVMGAVLAAVSPAVVVPRMVQLMESGRGTDKSIPQMILAGASCDDIFVIVLFTTFLHTAQGGSANAADFLSIPASIVLGVALGALVGWLLSRFFETAYARAHCIRNSMKVIIVLGVSLLLVAAEGWLEGIVPVSGLLAVVSMACLLKMKCTPFVAKRLSEKFGKLWLAAEVILFSDKICNDEETVRLHSHIQGMKRMLEEKEGIGRKLDFMAQEMNREANTILSKSSDLVISNIAIDLKTEIEKIREQIQNIE